jgi:hypothetical protein
MIQRITPWMLDVLRRHQLHLSTPTTISFISRDTSGRTSNATGELPDGTLVIVSPRIRVPDEHPAVQTFLVSLRRVARA